MHTITLHLTESEIKKIKKDFHHGQVYTDGCFCGHALSNFRDNLYIVVKFSCRKSMHCESIYYQVTDVMVTEKASNLYKKELLGVLLKKMEEDDDEEGLLTTEGHTFTLVNGDYEDTKTEDIHIVCERFVFSEDSLKAIQKKLFKYYKKTYGAFSEAKFKDVGHFND